MRRPSGKPTRRPGASDHQTKARGDRSVGVDVHPVCQYRGKQLGIDLHRYTSPAHCLVPSSHHIRKTPNFTSGIGAFRLADSASASTRRVSAGSITPSSHSRALA
jgi:hypothetical protein